MIPLTLLFENTHDACIFQKTFPDGTVLKESDIKIQSMPSKDSGNDYSEKTIWCAVQHAGVWGVAQYDLQISSNGNEFELYCHDEENERRWDFVAFPIDPAMTAKDINGATRIYPNATNDGWLFAHSEVSDHHDRIITLEAVMHTLFEDLVHDKLTDVLKAVVGHNNPSPPIGTALLYNYGAQSGSLANYQILVEFRKECVKWCAEVEKLLHVGQHVQEDDHYLKHQLVRAINQAKTVWKADTEGKARNLSAIEPQVNAIITRVETDHEIETRWAKVARQEAEKKKAAAASNSDTENG